MSLERPQAPASVSFPHALGVLRAAAEETRLRILALLSDGELSVSDLTDILGQSQPRISRHLKLLVEAGLIERHREGAWAFFRLAEGRAGLVDPLVAGLDRGEPPLSEDRARLDAVLYTHAHADHLSAAPYLQGIVGGQLAIGRAITRVQDAFGKMFNAGSEFARDGSDFDRLFDDGDRFAIGDLACTVLHVPGHTPADVAFVIGDAAFVGDTLFMPDYGTARADFPGGDAGELFRSIRRLLTLPNETRLFLCHDYKAPGREEFVWETTVGAQRTGNVHVRDGIDEEAFVTMRLARDATLSAPRLMLPSIQVNMRAGKLPEPEANGTRYLRIPLDSF